MCFEKLDDDYWLVDSVSTKAIEGKFPSSYASLFEMGDGSCDSFGINVDYLTEAVKAVKVINGTRNKKAYAIISAYDPIKPIHISASEDKNFEAVIMPVKI